MGYCGMVRNVKNSLIRTAGDNKHGLLSWYLDRNPTNCCAAWVCPAGTGCGYPKFAHKEGPENGYVNLAVFYISCQFNCLFCQNWHFRQAWADCREPSTLSKNLIRPEEIVSQIHGNVSCICYFGGDPTPQMIHSLRTSELALEKAEKKDQILRICWETNGGMDWRYLKRARDLALRSGGCIKIDLKCYDENLHRVLCGVSNKQTLENFRKLASSYEERPDIPIVIGATLLVPGYIDEEEVRKIARMIASINPEIPYTLLGFYPHFYLKDLPLTSRSHANRCLKAAKEEGLKNVHVGNLHLLSNASY